VSNPLTAQAEKPAVPLSDRAWHCLLVTLYFVFGMVAGFNLQQEERMSSNENKLRLIAAEVIHKLYLAGAKSQLALLESQARRSLKSIRHKEERTTTDVPLSDRAIEMLRDIRADCMPGYTFDQIIMTLAEEELERLKRTKSPSAEADDNSNFGL
jgi:hypothetical protein